MFSKEFYNTAIEMGYTLPVNLNPEVQVAVQNQMKRNIEDLNRKQAPWLRTAGKEYTAPEALEDTFNGEVFPADPAAIMNAADPTGNWYNTNKGLLYSAPAAEHDRKDVSGKPDPLLLPYEAVVAYSKVSDCGDSKYGNRDSWKNSTRGVSVYSNAAARHLFKSINEVHDAESGLPHLYHALWSVAAAIWHLEQKK